jgi:xylulokinase
VLGLPITPAVHVEAPAIGAGILAGIATNKFSSFEEAVEIVVETAPPIYPDAESENVYKKLRIEWEKIRDVVYPNLTSSSSQLK